MQNYDFLSLNDKEFEILVTSLLSVEESVRYERFKPGKDKGIDGRYFSAAGLTILQCKHWARSGVKNLLRSLATSEVKKVRKLNPVRYVIATSLPLSVSDKEAIYKIFHPYIKLSSDILGNEDLNYLLTKHQHIETSTYKLWMHSTVVLKQLANLAIRGRSQFTLEEIHRKRTRYVVTASHSAALQKLAEQNVIIVIGEPGIGKTTLAEQICLDFALKGYELCVATSEIQEFESLYDSGCKQIFYFDDFLGRTFLQALGRHEDSHITGFVKRIRADKTKRFILTSRTTILNRGKELSDLFDIEHLEQHELELAIDDLEDIDKARILHSAVWFSGLSASLVEVIGKDRHYRKIIDHQNFNPRLISFVTDPLRLAGVDATGYWSFISRRLDNPSDIWANVFDRQITKCQATIVFLVVVGGRYVDETNLMQAYREVMNDKLFIGINDERNFEKNIRVLIGSLIDRVIDFQSIISYSLFNPSIEDYVIPRIASDRDLASCLFRSFRTVDAIKFLGRLIEQNKFEIGLASAILNDILVAAANTEFCLSNLAYDVELLSLSTKYIPAADTTRHAAASFVDKILGTEEPGKYLTKISTLLGYCISNGLLDASTIEAFVVGLSDEGLDLEDASRLNKLALCVTDTGLRRELQSLFRGISLDIVREALSYEIHEREVLLDIYDISDKRLAERRIEETITEIMDEIGLKATNSEVWGLALEFDLDPVIEANIARSENENDENDDPTPPNAAKGESDEIDDLFLIDVPSDVSASSPI